MSVSGSPATPASSVPASSSPSFIGESYAATSSPQQHVSLGGEAAVIVSLYGRQPLLPWSGGMWRYGRANFAICPKAGAATVPP